MASTLVARMEESALDSAPIWDDIATFQGGLLRGGIDIITGGYPCQPFSSAGEMRGEQDSRHLWPHISRVIKETRSPILFFENVNNHIRMGFEEVNDELVGMGYRVAAGLFKAFEVGAPHKRERLFILAYSNSIGPRDAMVQGRGFKSWPEFIRSCIRPEWHSPERFIREVEWFKTEPRLGRVANGASNWLDRLRACGNGVIPLMAAYAFATLNNGMLYDCVSSLSY
jgi:DNA (cytosine-5)-methyltransferase 1